MNRLAAAFAWSLTVTLSPALLQAGTLYKCTDENGSVTFSDVACPDKTAERREIQIRHSQPASPGGGDYWSVENQMKRLDAEKAQERQERGLRSLLQEQRDRDRAMQQQAEENKKEADKLHEDAQDLYRKAARMTQKRQKEQQKALIEQARSLERQADVLLGRRETAAPTQTERLQQQMEEAQETAREAEETARQAESAAHAAESAARRAEIEARNK